MVATHIKSGFLFVLDCLGLDKVKDTF